MDTTMLNTPWGEAQHQQEICDGVYTVDTAGHGGIMVHARVARSLLSELALAKSEHWDEWYCFEEDCDWALFGYECPDLLAPLLGKTPEALKQDAYDCLIHYHVGYLAMVKAGIKIAKVPLRAKVNEQKSIRQGSALAELFIDPQEQSYTVCLSSSIYSASTEIRIQFDSELSARTFYDLAEHVVDFPSAKKKGYV